MNSVPRIIPIYTTRGDVGAFLAYPYILDKDGEWIGWITPERHVYSVYGHYVGYLDSGPRILRKVADELSRSRRMVPPPPPRVQLPATVPLAPMMPELKYGIMDVLEEYPELLPSVDTGDLKEDMD